MAHSLDVRVETLSTESVRTILMTLMTDPQAV